MIEHCHIYMVKQIIVSWSTSRLLEIDIIFTYHAAISEQSEKTTKLLLLIIDERKKNKRSNSV
jgi:hypothetical protein